MAVRCMDILNLPSLKSMKIVAGHNSLNRIIRWVHVLDIPHASKWVQGGELLFITGIGIKDIVKELKELVKDIESRNLAGLVINVGPYISKTPGEVSELADSLGFPVFELPWKVKLVEVTHEICSFILTKQMEERSINQLLEDIILRNYENTESLDIRAAFHGFNLNSPSYVLAINAEDYTHYLKKARISDGHSIMKLKTQFLYVVTEILSLNNKKFLYTLKGDSIRILIQTSDIDEIIEIKNIADKIRSNVAKQLSGLTVSIGIGSIRTKLKDIRESYLEAEIALKIAQTEDEGNKTVYYRESGFSRLIFSITDKKELNLYYQDTLSALVEYDKSNNTCLILTLYNYLTKNKNLKETSQKLHIHVNTLKYRLKRIEEISGCNLENTSDCLNLLTGLIISKII